ncbi:2-amino-4-hydroxy-6-hydroxymethyldihydropteridinediphosphokinase [soil metagenome]
MREGVGSNLIRVHSRDSRALNRAGIALGSNLGDRLGNLRAARRQLRLLSRAESPVLASAVYETEPVGCEPGAGAFLNAVVEIGVGGEPQELLRQLRRIEQELGRPPEHAKNTSRTLDLDLLYFGAEQISTGVLQLPHPRLHERRFVLQPLADIRADLVLPGQMESVGELLARLGPTPPLVRSATEW